MTREEAIKELTEDREFLMKRGLNETESGMLKALEMAIKALENIGHLTDRPCSVCEFRKENGCCKWTCAFTEKLFGDMGYNPHQE